MAAHVRRRDGNLILTGDNALPLTAFALAFSPVSPLSVAAFAALKVSFPGACPGKDDFYFDEETTSSLRVARSNVFSSCYSFVFKVRFRGAKTNYMNFSSSARKTFLNVSLLSPRENKKRCITSAMQRFYYHFLRLAAQPITAPSVYTTIKTNVAIKTNSTFERRSSVTFASMKQAAIVAA